MTSHSTRGILPILAAASLLLTACSDDSTGATSPGGSSSGTTAHDSGGEPPWTLLEATPEDVTLDAGAYGLTANGVSQKVAVVQAPTGFMQLGGWTFVDGEPFRAMGFVTADRVYRDPCGPTMRSKAAVDPGPGVDDLAAALVAQKGVTASRPRPVTVGGHDGLYLDYQVSKGVEVEDCGERAVDIFSTGPGAWYLETSRERAAIWILDVDGECLVLAWVAFPGVPRGQLQEMTDMAESATFVDSE
jgi:hypothetical protein